MSIDSKYTHNAELEEFSPALLAEAFYIHSRLLAARHIVFIPHQK